MVWHTFNDAHLPGFEDVASKKALSEVFQASGAGFQFSEEMVAAIIQITP
jgi:hypothetical protein